MIRLAAISLMMILGINACSTEPVYRTKTSYVAPKTSQEATCAASCRTTEQICRGRADDFARAEYPACMERAKQTYVQCMRGDYKMGCPLARQNAENACTYNMTTNYGSCTSSYNSCYESCGGKVVREKVCVKNCDA